MSKKSICIAALCCLAAVLVCSCSSHSEGSSFTSALDSVDVAVSQNSVEDALKSLKKLEKKAYASYEFLGIAKRYFFLGEAKLAERVLKKSLKKNPKNPELSAVYANFLLRKNRLEEAFQISLCLKDSRYSSIYAECVLKKALVAIENGEPVLESAFNSVSQKKKNKSAEIKTSEEIKEIFCSPDFISVYKNAFDGSDETLWIFNAASIFMRGGEFKNAVALYPKKISSNKESLFWGCVFFDSGLYAESIAVLEASSRLASFAEKTDLPTKTEILSLESDGFYIEGEENSSEEIRQNLIQNFSKIPPQIYMNSAMFAKRNGNFETEQKLLEFLSANFPDYLPGLAALGEFSLEQIKNQHEDFLSQKIRNAGLKTLSMEKKAKVPVVPFDSVLEKLDSIIASQSSEALVLKDALVAQKNKLDKTEKPVSDIWLMLEKNVSAENIYPESVLKHCVFSLLNENSESDAETLFDSYYKSKYDFLPEDSPENLELWECELCAWFACKKGNFKSGISLYNFIAENYGNRIVALNSSSKNSSIINAFVNLGVLYASVDRLPEALDSLNTASAKSSEGKEKSEILFRIAQLEWKQGNLYCASRALKYALSLDSENNKVRLLQKKIQAEK